MSQSRRRMLDLVNRLHSTGVQVDIDLPQIAVIGSQSAGKSSLIESISGITLPRAAGTCTRCPTECRLSYSRLPWKCIVHLRFTTDANGTPLGQSRNEIFGSTIYEKSEVEERIRRAQRAILNPGKAAKVFLEDKDGLSGEAELSFSNNCVSLQISGPDVADLSFCDLPGLIASVGQGGNTNDIKLVESLVTSYIKKPSCIILLTVACETDFENQGAHQISKAHDPEGKRTIGVLTKPDRIPLGEESNWLKFIKNEREPLENNWYCVKQPSSNDLKNNWTWQEARENEQQFFAGTAPWCELEGMYQKYLRTTNLVERLSGVLSDLIAKRLPEIQDELERSVQKTQGLLAQLPREPSKQPVNEVATLLHKFVADVVQHITGIPDEKGLIQSIRPAQERFRREIRATAPKFRSYEKKLAGTRSMPRAEFLANEDDVYSEDESAQPAASDTSTGKRKRRNSVVYVDEVFERAQRSRTRELPGNYPFVVQQGYIDECIKEWRSPAHILCKAVYNTVSDYLKRMVNRHFPTFGQGMLEHRVRILLQDHLKACLARTEERINWLLDLEDKAFSLNTHYLSDYKSKFLAYYRSARRKNNHNVIMDSINAYAPPANPTPAVSSKQAPNPVYGVSKVLSGLTEMGFNGVQANDLAKLLRTDNMEPAIEIMADVRAYFQVAYKRFSDNIPMAIDRELVCGAGRDILPLLRNGLGLNSLEAHRICKELAQENTSVANRREELVKKPQRLDEASQQLLQVSGA
ncbi:hypothetical protein AGABI1DRAFT_56763 [Agaricus bisporus var. burnettii JB137-S8]|uniref:GED domain-containing protein n=1 Tax=Agaricus bisporus var. burnettii (strain JB137-S8 / ATCC MYA-4627 / FGSC 10392) TaxID=597362 RepID=K5W3C5_AGABU|nr:uncharacterized protein AGABI1DRAFT_56763 [Agaricus bisporus var. burnettii JB137-S8]EKM81299.1 hypothetical protein AGABI1DRAFT_56763 [Agaricus bisporus var. burnettii JB137-S8]